MIFIFCYEQILQGTQNQVHSRPHDHKGGAGEEAGWSQKNRIWDEEPEVFVGEEFEGELRSN